MIRRIFHRCLLLAILSGVVYMGHTRNDTLKTSSPEKLFKEARLSDTKDPERMIFLANMALKKIDQKRDLLLLAEYHYIVGLANYYLSNYDIAVDHYLLAVDIHEKMDNGRGVASNYINLSLVYKDIGDTASAMVYNTRALEIFTDLNDKAEIANTLNKIGNCFLYRNNRKAEEYFRKSFAIRKELGNQKDIGSSLNNLGIVFQISGEIDSAVSYFRKSYQIYEELGNKQYMAVALSNIAIMEEFISGPEKKVEYLLKSLDYSHEAEYPRGEVNTLTNLAQHYFVSHDYERSLEYLEQAMNICHDHDLDNFRVKLYWYYSELYRQKGDFEQAIFYIQRYIALKDSVQTDNRSRIARLQMRYLTEKHEREQALRELEIKKERNQKVFFLIIAILVAIIAILVLSRYFLRMKSARLLEEKNMQLERMNRKLITSERKLKELNATKDKFFSIIAHDLKNPLGTIRNIFDFFRENFSVFSKEQQEEYLTVLDESIKSTYALLQNLLQWSMSQSGRLETNREIFDLAGLAKEVCNYGRILGENNHIAVNSNIAPDIYVEADKNMVDAVLRNLVVNAVKFSYQETEVRVGAFREADKVTVSVSDQGIGMSEKEISKLFRIEEDVRSIGAGSEEASKFIKNKGTGLGLILCFEFVKKNNGDIWVESAPGKGATFYFTLEAAKQERKHEE